MTPQQMFDRLQKEAREKADFVVPASKMRMNDEGLLEMGNGSEFARLLQLNRTAGEQLAQYTGIPQKYWDRMASEQPELLARNVNTWLARKGEEGEKRLVRTIGDTARAVLSSKFRIMDNLEMLQVAMPEFAALGVVPFRAQLSDNHLYLTVVSNSIMADLPPGSAGAWGSDAYREGAGGYHKMHRLVAALTLKNSEVGKARLTVMASVVVSACRNLSMMDEGIAKMHLGRAMDGEGNIEDFLSDEAREADSKALNLAVRDTIRATFNEEKFKAIVDKFRGLRETKVDEPIALVKRLAERESLNEDRLLEAFFKEPEPTAFGIQQALTLYAQGEEHGEDQARLEQLAGELLKGPVKFLEE